MTATSELLAQLALPPGPPPVVVVTRLQSLPLTSLRWDDFEKLCLQLVRLDHEVEDARRYGLPGQDQHGIDLYTRQAQTGEYTAYQCKKVDRFGAADISSAVEQFLAGPWAARASRFVVCCTVSFAATQLADRFEAERERLARRNVVLGAWDADTLNMQLKEQSSLVADFFGIQAATAFCVDSKPARNQGRKRRDTRLQREDPPIADQNVLDHVLNAALGSAQMMSAFGQAYSLSYIASRLRTDDPERVMRLFEDAERLANSVVDDGDKAAALASVARHLLFVDPRGAVRLIVDAENIFRSITDEYQQVYPFASISRFLAIVDPDRAEQLAQSVSSGVSRDCALASLARELAVVDFHRAERLAQAMSSDFLKPMALADVVAQATVEHLSEAEVIAQAINDEHYKAAALASLARSVAAADPDRARRLVAEAERLARSVPSNYSRVYALVDVARGMTAIDQIGASKLLAEAQRTVKFIGDHCRQASPMARIAGVTALIDARRAERIARRICDEDARSEALTSVAEVVVSDDPVCAERIARSITDNGQRAQVLMHVFEVLSVKESGNPADHESEN